MLLSTGDIARYAGRDLTLDDHRAPCLFLILTRATDLEHGQFAAFARSGMERDSVIDGKPQKRGANRRQDRYAAARNVSIKRINQDDFLNLSDLFGQAG